MFAHVRIVRGATRHTPAGLIAFTIFASQLPAVAPAAAVGVFDNGSFVDTSGGTSAESDNVQATLGSLGHTVGTFTGFAAADWTAAFAANDVVVIPELETGPLHASLTPAARTAIAAAVDAGKKLVVFAGAGDRDELLLNGVFGYSIAVNSYSREATALDAAAAAGTSFAGGPASLPWNNGTYYHLNSQVPAGALNVYHNSTESALWAKPQGAGSVIFLAYDWYDAAPAGTQNGGWVTALDNAVTYAVPEPASLSALAVGGVLLGRRRRA